MADTLASALNRTARAKPSFDRSNAPRCTVTCLLSMLETWEERKRFRIKLEDMLITNPHLIDDVGLTRKQVEAEIAKPFWRD